MNLHFERVIDDYVAAWNVADPEERAALLERSFAVDGIYRDPSVRVIGRDALASHSRRFAERWPGARVVRTSAIDNNHHSLCFTWRVHGADGSVLRQGLDVIRIDESGLVTDVQGFFGAYSAPKALRPVVLDGARMSPAVS